MEGFRCKSFASDFCLTVVTANLQLRHEEEQDVAQIVLKLR